MLALIFLKYSSGDEQILRTDREIRASGCGLRRTISTYGKIQTTKYKIQKNFKFQEKTNPNSLIFQDWNPSIRNQANRNY